MDNNLLFPPLRLVLNTTCNGKCYFCHHEGNTVSDEEMPISIITECVDAAKQLQIRKISLTGGEPTLRTDIDDIVCLIKQKYPKVDLGITTNGFRLSEVSQNTLKLLDHINLSIISFDEPLIDKY